MPYTTISSTCLKKNQIYVAAYLIISLFANFKTSLIFVLFNTIFVIVFYLFFHYSIHKNLRHVSSFSISILSLIILMLDDIFVPNLMSISKFYFIKSLDFFSHFFFYSILFIFFYTIIFISKKIISISVQFSIFMSFNSFFLLFNLIQHLLSDSYPKYHKIQSNSSPVSEFIQSQVLKKRNILVVCLDSYPSSKLFYKKYNIHNNIDSILYGYNKKDFHSNYISTPLSLANLLFDIKFKENIIFKKGENELLLFQNAYSSSTLFPLNQNEYNEYWHSFISSESIFSTLGFSFWSGIYETRSLFFKIYTIYFDRYIFDEFNKKEKMIYSYNENSKKILSVYITENDTKRKFIFLHFLTFHNSSETRKTEMLYANDIVKYILSNVPKNYSVLFFSDHGLRDSNFNMEEKKSGIFYFKESESR